MLRLIGFLSDISNGVILNFMCNVFGTSTIQLTKTLSCSHTSTTSYTVLIGVDQDDFGSGSGNNVSLRVYSVYKVSKSQIKFTVYTTAGRQVITLGY